MAAEAEAEAEVTGTGTGEALLGLKAEALFAPNPRTESLARPPEASLEGRVDVEAFILTKKANPLMGTAWPSTVAAKQ